MPKDPLLGAQRDKTNLLSPRGEKKAKLATRAPEQPPPSEAQRGTYDPMEDYGFVSIGER